MPPRPRSALHARIGRRVRELRLSRGLTQADLAEQIRCSSHFVSGIERGVDSPSLITLEALARALGTTVGDLTREETSATQEALHQLAAVLGDRRDPRLLQVLREVAELYDSSQAR